jgi:hypothetical protein
MITCSKCGNVEYDCVHRSKIIRMIERIRNQQHDDVNQKELDLWAITYLEELIE